MQARRLRAKLVRYYREEGRADPTLIELPKGGYAPVIKRRDDAGRRQAIGQRRAGQPQHRSPCCRLPITAATGSLDGFCKGMREEVVHHLARLPGAAHPGGATTTGRGRRRRRRGGAALVISGSVRQSGDRLRMAVQLIDGASGCYLWSESVDGSRDDALRRRRSWSRDAVAKKLEPERGGRGAAAAVAIGRPRIWPRRICTCRAAIT